MPHHQSLPCQYGPSRTRSSWCMGISFRTSQQYPQPRSLWCCEPSIEPVSNTISHIPRIHSTSPRINYSPSFAEVNIHSVNIANCGGLSQKLGDSKITPFWTTLHRFPHLRLSLWIRKGRSCSEIVGSDAHYSGNYARSPEVSVHQLMLFSKIRSFSLVIYRDVKARWPPDEDDINHLGSFTKSLTAAGLGISVDEDKWSQNTNVRDILPESRQISKTVEDHATVADFSSRGNGLTPQITMWLYGCAGIASKRRETLKIILYLESVIKLSSRWLYNNRGYASGKFHRWAATWTILRTISLSTPFKAFWVVSTVRQSTPIPTSRRPTWRYQMARRSASQDRKFWMAPMEGAAGLRSINYDMLKYAKVLMSAAEQRTRKSEDHFDSLFGQIQTVFKCDSVPSSISL